MPEDDEMDDTLSDVQQLITKIVGVATINRWDFAVNFSREGGTNIAVHIPARDQEET